jgi:hypothetical protein
MNKTNETNEMNQKFRVLKHIKNYLFFFVSFNLIKNVKIYILKLIYFYMEILRNKISQKFSFLMKTNKHQRELYE